MRNFSAPLTKLARSVRNPSDVQKVLYDIEYSRKDTMKSALMVWESGTAHCLEAVHLAALLLEARGFPPLALSLDSADNICHVVYAYKKESGWGSVGRSKEPGLHGRSPIFRNIRELALSYFDPYVDDTGRLTGFALVNLDESKSDWRYSKRNVWQSEKHVLNTPHKTIHGFEGRYQSALRNYKDGGHRPQVHWR